MLHRGTLNIEYTFFDELAPDGNIIYKTGKSEDDDLSSAQTLTYTNPHRFRYSMRLIYLACSMIVCGLRANKVLAAPAPATTAATTTVPTPDPSTTASASADPFHVLAVAAGKQYFGVVVALEELSNTAYGQNLDNNDLFGQSIMYHV
jgi:hypothetical protein